MHNTNTKNIRAEFNSIYSEINSPLKKKQNKLNCLDITITNLHGQLKFKIFKKPTCTDLIIHKNSPIKKTSAIKYVTNSTSTYPIISLISLQTLKQKQENIKMEKETICEDVDWLKLR
jgi:hypothetical protein